MLFCNAPFSTNPLMILILLLENSILKYYQVVLKLGVLLQHQTMRLLYPHLLLQPLFQKFLFLK